jgi:hypothetical protein
MGFSWRTGGKLEHTLEGGVATWGQWVSPVVAILSSTETEFSDTRFRGTSTPTGLNLGAGATSVSKTVQVSGTELPTKANYSGLARVAA